MWLQWLHPTVVHFSIGLLFTGVFLDVLGLWRSNETLTWAGYWNTVMGAAATVVALVTGLFASARLGDVTDIGRALLPFHEITAWAGTLLAVGLAGVRIAMKGPVRKKLRTVYLSAAFLTAGIIFTSGALGGALVYAYGLGINPSAARRVVEAQPDFLPAE